MFKMKKKNCLSLGLWEQKRKGNNGPFPPFSCIGFFSAVALLTFWLREFFAGGGTVLHIVGCLVACLARCHQHLLSCDHQKCLQTSPNVISEAKSILMHLLYSSRVTVCVSQRPVKTEIHMVQALSGWGSKKQSPDRIYTFHLKEYIYISPGGSDSKESACSAGDLGLILGQEEPLEKGMAPHSSILPWRIWQTEEPGGLQSMRLQRIRHDLWHPTPVLLPEKSHGWRSLVDCSPWGH